MMSILCFREESSQNVNLFQIYQRFGLLFGGNWCKSQFSYQYKSKRHQCFTGVFLLFTGFKCVTDINVFVGL